MPSLLGEQAGAAVAADVVEAALADEQHRLAGDLGGHELRRGPAKADTWPTQIQPPRKKLRASQSATALVGVGALGEQGGLEQGTEGGLELFGA